jgi:2-oxoglutarate dehydrogenase E2 component (dihydrolipoamide succinyltransferase)
VVAQEGEVVEPMTAMRRGVMEHMRRSLDTSAHVTSAIEVDMSKIVAAREALKREYQSAYGVNPTYLSFVAHATVETLRDYPWINGEIRGESIVTRPFVNLGIAVALDEGKGLIVPVIRNAQDLNLLGMARAISDLAARARRSRRRRATRSCCPTTSRAARSRSRTPAATGRSTARRSSASPRRGSSAPTRS